MEFVCFEWISEQTSHSASQKTRRLISIIEVESVFCAVRTESFYTTDSFRLQKINTIQLSPRVVLSPYVRV